MRLNFISSPYNFTAANFTQSGALLLTNLNATGPSPLGAPEQLQPCWAPCPQQAVSHIGLAMTDPACLTCFYHAGTVMMILQTRTRGCLVQAR